MEPQGGSGECPPWRGWAGVEDTSHPHSTRAPGLDVCRHPQPRSLLVGIRFQAQDPPHTWESHGAWGGCGSAGLDMAESLRGDTCPLTLGRSSWRAPGARWTRGPREGSPVPQTCRADPGTGRADLRAWGAGAAGRDGAPGGRARVGSPPAAPQHQDPPWGRRDPLPGSRPQRRGQAARPRTPPGCRGTRPRATLLAGNITAHSVLPHTFTAGAQVHTGRVHAPGSAGRWQAEAFARAPGAGAGNAQAAGLAQGT